MVSAPPLRHVQCTPGPSKGAGGSVSHTLGDIERPRYNAFLHKRRLPVPECAVRALLPPEAKPFRVRVRTAPDRSAPTLALQCCMYVCSFTNLPLLTSVNSTLRLTHSVYADLCFLTNSCLLAQDTFELEQQHTPGSLPVLHAIFPPGQPAEAVLNEFSCMAELFCTTLGTSLLSLSGLLRCGRYVLYIQCAQVPTKAER